MTDTDLEERVRKKLRTDYSAPIEFDLETELPDKTIDIGKDGTWVSADPLGRILQLSAFHPKHGVVVAVPFEQFDGNRFRDQRYVRRYRTRMLECIQDGRPGYGIVLREKPQKVAVITPRPNVANLQFRLPGSGVDVLTNLLVHGEEVIQTVTLTNPGSEARDVEYELLVKVSVNRASYGQLTEGGPLPIPQSENRVDVASDRHRFSVYNRWLMAHIEGCFFVGDEPQALDSLQIRPQTNLPIVRSIPRSARLPPTSSLTLTARFRLFWGTHPFKEPLPSVGGLVSDACKLLSTAADWKDAASLETYMIRRTLDYIIGNCLMPVEDDYCAIVADHVALPLGWNRDNYWQVRFLLKVERAIDSLLHPAPAAFYGATIRRAIKEHLNWVYRKAERPRGYWHRSYLVTGSPKDGPVFQLDQQLYPLLELCDFYEAYQNEAEFVRGILSEPVLVQVLKVIHSKIDLEVGLVPTEESPGDDKIDYPFHFSTHVVLWYALSRLSKLLDAFAEPDNGTAEFVPPNFKRNFMDESPSSSPDSIVDQVKAMFGIGTTTAAAALPSKPSYVDEARSYVMTLQALTMQLAPFLVLGKGGRPMFAYVTNGKGKYTLYHDGNDIPTLFVTRRQLNIASIFSEVNAELGVLQPTDSDEIEQAWINTMTFAFSPRNKTGYCQTSTRGHDEANGHRTHNGNDPNPSGPASYPFGGLGSVHSHGAWTLGYFQEFMFGRIIGSASTERDAWRRIVGAMQWDGSFAEAVDARTGRCVSKAWFSWPGSMIAAALVEAREEEGNLDLQRLSITDDGNAEGVR